VPDGQAVGAFEPATQYEPGGHVIVGLKRFWQKKPAGHIPGEDEFDGQYTPGWSKEC
jgi:hypothetical protein